MKADKVKLFWVNRVDEPRLYTQIDPDQEHSQHTFSGHVWLVTDQGDKPIGVYEATDFPRLSLRSKYVSSHAAARHDLRLACRTSSSGSVRACDRA